MSAHNKSFRSIALILAGILVLSSAVGCGEDSGTRWWRSLPGYGGYWWQRGQPKSVSQLLAHAQEKLTGNLQAFGGKRPELVEPAKTMNEVLNSVVSGLAGGESKDAIAKKLSNATNVWFLLEGQLSVGSRAAYGELASEMRNFSRRAAMGENLQDDKFRESLGLFSMRVFSFLANELSVPAPVDAAPAGSAASTSSVVGG